MGLALTQGASLPLLAAVAAAGVSSAYVIGRELLNRNATSLPVDAKMAETHLSYATNVTLDANLRVQHAYRFVHSVDTVPATDAERLLATLPRGRDWGVRKKLFKREPITKSMILKSIGLGDWSQPSWTPYDVEVVLNALHKLGPVTEAQRSSLRRSALQVVSESKGRSEKKATYLADLDAAVNELCRRAPAAVADHARSTEAYT